MDSTSEDARLKLYFDAFRTSIELCTYLPNQGTLRAAVAHATTLIASSDTPCLVKAQAHLFAAAMDTEGEDQLARKKAHIEEAEKQVKEAWEKGAGKEYISHLIQGTEKQLSEQLDKLNK